MDGIVFASDSRTHAGVDNFASFCKMSVFERPGDRVIVLLSSGNLAGTQAVITTLRQRGDAPAVDATTIWNARTMFDVAGLVAAAVRDVERCDAPAMVGGAHPFNAPRSSSVGRYVVSRRALFRTFSRKAISSRLAATHRSSRPARPSTASPSSIASISPTTNLADAMKCLLVSMDSTMRSNLSVGHAHRPCLLRAGCAARRHPASIRAGR
ncbi:MAG: peptidase [Pseudomonadota bacterium]